MKNLFLVFLFFLSVISMDAQKVVKLWENTPPTSNGLSETELNEDGRISNVTTPELTVYLPDSAVNKGIAVIICPGGGYARLAIDHEGHDFAKWLQSQGIAGIVLKYRMPNKVKQVPLEDFNQAITYVRSNASEWKISNDKIGVAGFSAGGHLAATASTHFSSKELRPDFSILFYPVITMGDFTHEGSRNNLLGETPSASEIMYYSNERQVNEFTPPAILLLSDDDTAVPPKNSITYYSALKDNKIPATMYIFPSGGHGWGMRDNFEYHKEMLSLLSSWLKTLSF